MVNKFSLSLGNFLFKHAFPVYRVVYPIFKMKQDKEEINFFKRTIQPGMTVLDIGANIGFYSKILADLVGESGTIHSFEPDTVNFQRLVKSTSSLPQIKLVQKAVTDYSGVLKIYTSKMLNVDHRSYEVEEYDQVFEIPCVSIDEYLGVNNHVDIIKMDIQGAEYTALKGMAHTLAANPHIQMLMEFWPYGLKSAGYSAIQLFELIQGYGFSMFFTEGDKSLKINEKNINEYQEKPKDYYQNILIKRQ